MKRLKLTIFHIDGTEEFILSKCFKKEDGWAGGGLTAIGYIIYLDDDSQILVHPNMHRRIKIEVIDAQ